MHKFKARNFPVNLVENASLHAPHVVEVEKVCPWVVDENLHARLSVPMTPWHTMEPQVKLNIYGDTEVKTAS